MPLRLKSLELHGYKTFALRTVFEFASGITAIVGPNGSGKSNIADALRWVLGEQSYSLLRGKKTEDMIFSGSEQRARAGMASAEIVFDNSTNWLPIEFAEVAMTRRAYRDGHNEYLLNDQQVRLRDMNELLAASGLSERTYTILGQGLVDASLALKADERRRLFEEAAGVGLYRVRREETLKRLEHTQRNLERIQDIMSELEPRLKTLERQARRANEFAAAQADLRVLLREWYGYHWHRAQQELNMAREAVRLQDDKAARAREAHLAAQAQHSRFRERLGALRAELNVWHHQSSELHAQRETVSLDLAVLEERRRSITSGQTALLSEQAGATSEGDLARQRFAEIEEESVHLQVELDEARSQLTSAQQILQARQSERGRTEGDLQAARNAVAALQVQKAETQARLDELAIRLLALQQKLESAQHAIRSVEAEVESSDRAHSEAQARRQGLESQLGKSITALEETKRRVEELEETRRAGLEERTKLETRQSRLQASLEVVEQAEQSLAGYAEGARFLLSAARQAQLRTRGALSAVLDVPAEFETAIAAALGDTLDAVLVGAGEIEAALHLLESEEAGRAALLPFDGQSGRSLSKPNDVDCLGIAAELVRAPADLRSATNLLLGNTLVVRTRTAARRLISIIPIHARIVTLRGEVFRGDGLIIAGKSAASSTLGRVRQKRELAESLKELGKHLDGLNASIEKLSSDLVSAQGEQSGREEALARMRAEVEQAQAVEQKVVLNRENLRRQLEWHNDQEAELKKDLSEAAEERSRLAALASDSEAKVVQIQNDVRALTGRLSELSIDEAQEAATYWAMRLAVTEQSLKSIQARKSERQQALERLVAQVQSSQSRLEEAEQALTQLQSEETTLHTRESDLNQKIEALRVLIEPGEKALEETEKEENRLQEAEAGAQKSLTNAERAAGQAQIDLVRRQEALDSLREKIMDDFGLVSFQYAENMEGPVPLPFEGLVEELLSVSELAPDLEAQLMQQRAHLRRLGPINPEAKKEYDSDAERYSFMTTQLQDLRQAEADLRQVIAEMDELTKQEFSRTFESVDKQFRAIFTRLFGGGSARLSLTDPDNLVETGIEIEARLPGRRPQGLSLLSGGERSLTAIALVFALLKVSPTPVCVMDEVDAMLDEANVGRFRDLLRDLSKDTQFIIITHNRNTVQAADVIYGVTMGRDSASQVISLRLDEVSEEMLGSAK